jgi:hypothetical protein
MWGSSQKNIEKRKPIKQEGKVDIPRSRNEKESEFCFLQIKSPMVFFLKKLSSCTIILSSKLDSLLLQETNRSWNTPTWTLSLFHVCTYIHVQVLIFINGKTVEFSEREKGGEDRVVFVVHINVFKKIWFCCERFSFYFFLLVSRPLMLGIILFWSPFPFSHFAASLLL